MDWTRQKDERTSAGSKSEQRSGLIDGDQADEPVLTSEHPSPRPLHRGWVLGQAVEGTVAGQQLISVTTRVTRSARRATFAPARNLALGHRVAAALQRRGPTSSENLTPTRRQKGHRQWKRRTDRR
jgi:hypothetical protein